jgi:hypothetical protein
MRADYKIRVRDLNQSLNLVNKKKELYKFGVITHIFKNI